MLPKVKTKEQEYDSWAGEVAIDGYNDGKYGRSFIGKIEGEDTWFNAGKKLSITLEKGCVYSIKMGRKVGTKSWYVNTATLIGGDATPTPPATTKTEKHSPTTAEPRLTDKEKADGQAKGNYRTGLMAFICTHYQMTKSLPSSSEIQQFNATIKGGESDFGGEDKPEAPVGTKGLIE